MVQELLTGPIELMNSVFTDGFFVEEGEHEKQNPKQKESFHGTSAIRRHCFYEGTGSFEDNRGAEAEEDMEDRLFRWVLANRFFGGDGTEGGPERPPERPEEDDDALPRCRWVRANRRRVEEDDGSGGEGFLVTGSIGA